jgi:hypothetical protein
MLLFALTPLACGDDEEDGGARILECDGTCSCNEDTRPCSCGLSCGSDCDIICPGTTGCTAEAGASASFECQGNASCEFTCLADCSVLCQGAAQCLVTCDDTEPCDLENCSGSTDCGNGVFACGRACP